MTNRPTNIRWIVLPIVAFAAASAYLTRYCISAANTTIQADLGLDETQMGPLLTAFFVGYLWFQIPGGWLGDRLGTRFAFALFSILWSLCNAWTALATEYWSLWGSRLALGLCQAGLTPVSAKIIKDWIPLPFRGKSSASIGACMSIGGAFTMTFTGWLLKHDFLWRDIFLAYAGVGIVWAVGFYWFFRTFPHQHRGVNEAELALIRDDPQELLLKAPVSIKSTATKTTVTKTTPMQNDRVLLTMLKSTGLWGLCVQSFFRAAGYAFFVTWFFYFLEKRYSIDKGEAGLLTSLPLIAVVLGTTAGGVIVDRLFRRTGSQWISRSGTAFVALTACGILTAGSALTDNAWQLAAVIALGAFFSGVASPAAWAATIDIGAGRTALYMGTMNMAGCLAGAILPTALGNWFYQIRTEGGDWNMVIYLHAAFYFIGAAAWLGVTYKRGKTPAGGPPI